MKNLLFEDIKRISSLMYGKKNLISEKFSKETKNYFDQNNFIASVFPGDGFTNQFFKAIKSTYEKSTTIDRFQFMLQTENPQYDNDAWDMKTVMGTDKARALVVAKDPTYTNNNKNTQKNPTNWETYVFLSKWNYNQSTASMVQKQFPSLNFSEDCIADDKQVFCLKGTITKEQVVQVSNYLEEPNWVKLDLANPQKQNVA